MTIYKYRLLVSKKIYAHYSLHCWLYNCKDVPKFNLKSINISRFLDIMLNIIKILCTFHYELQKAKYHKYIQDYMGVINILGEQFIYLFI